MVIKINGAPGTGKTTQTISEFEKALYEGYKPEQILFTTYRRNAADDAKVRIRKATGVCLDDTRRINTTHGICLSLLAENGYLERPRVNHEGKISESPIMQSRDYRRFGEECGYDIGEKKIIADDFFMSKTDPYLNFYGIYKSTRTPMSDMYIHCTDSEKSYAELKRFVKDYERWKSEKDKIDFSDMLEIVLRDGLFPGCPIQIYDECQDMTTQLYDVAKMWSTEADEVYLAGDPLQTLYPFWGADPRHFVEWAGETVVLPVSQRLTQNIWKVAEKIIEMWTPYHVPDITVTKTDGYIGSMDSGQLYSFMRNTPRNPNYKAFHLVRTAYTGYKVAKTLASLGIPFGGIEDYAWSDEHVQLYNTIKAIREYEFLTADDICCLLDWYPMVDPFLVGKNKSKKKRAIREDKKSKNLRKKWLPNGLLDVIRKNPLGGCIIKGLHRFKLEKAIEMDIPYIQPEDIEKMQVLTIHGAKGMEADSVFLHNEITRSVNLSMHTKKGRENEAYVWYVGVTRSRRNLFIVNYLGNNYPIPIGVCS